VDLFTELQKEAREAGRGLWNEGEAASWKGPTGIATDPNKVYVTKQGKKYHKGGCRYLAKSAIETKTEEAKKKGYEACKVCLNPNRPVTDTTKYYITKTGSKYHRGGCSYLSKSAILISLEDAKGGYGPCSRCIGKSSGSYSSGSKSKSSSGSKSKAYKSRCSATTKKGTQCKRNSKSGSSYCWQHGG